jgi:ankyrin repeat protein
VTIHVLDQNFQTPLMVALINKMYDIAEILVTNYEIQLSAMDNLDQYKKLIAQLHFDRDSGGDNLLLLTIYHNTLILLIEKMVSKLNCFGRFLPSVRTHL